MCQATIYLDGKEIMQNVTMVEILPEVRRNGSQENRHLNLARIWLVRFGKSGNLNNTIIFSD